MVEPHTELGPFAAWAKVRQLAAGTPIAQRGDAPAHWIGVASGAVRLGSELRDGRNFTLEFVGPSQWFGDSEPIDDRPLDLDLRRWPKGAWCWPVRPRPKKPAADQPESISITLARSRRMPRIQRS